MLIISFVSILYAVIPYELNVYRVVSLIKLNNVVPNITKDRREIVIAK